MKDSSIAQALLIYYNSPNDSLRKDDFLTVIKSALKLNCIDNGLPYPDPKLSYFVGSST
jgi:hypothetical protein